MASDALTSVRELGEELASAFALLATSVADAQYSAGRAEIIRAAGNDGYADGLVARAESLHRETCATVAQRLATFGRQTRDLTAVEARTASCSADKCVCADGFVASTESLLRETCASVAQRLTTLGRQTADLAAVENRPASGAAAACCGAQPHCLPSGFASVSLHVHAEMGRCRPRSRTPP